MNRNLKKSLNSKLALGLLLFSLIASPLHAGELLNSFVDEKDDHYILHLDMRIDGQYDDVYEVLIDFDNIPAVNDSIKSSRLLKSEGKVHLVEYQTEGCIWFFCREVKQTVTVTEMGRGYIMSLTHPMESDLKYGRTLWHVIDEGETTRIKYNSDFVPDFWVPPVFGPVMLQDRMLEEGIRTINGIEKLVTTSFD